jgi:hypothetical protein
VAAVRRQVWPRSAASSRAEVDQGSGWCDRRFERARRVFGVKAGVRNNAPVADVPGVQLRFTKADTAQAPTKGRVLDHISFDVTT